MSPRQVPCAYTYRLGPLTAYAKVIRSTFMWPDLRCQGFQTALFCSCCTWSGFARMASRPGNDAEHRYIPAWASFGGSSQPGASVMRPVGASVACGGTGAELPCTVGRVRRPPDHFP